MADHTPLTDQQLDAIEARAMAATDGPWGVYQYGGDSLIEIAADLEETGHGYRARRTIARFDEEPLDNDPRHREWTAEEDWAQVQADARFIAAMSPDTVKALVTEVRRLRAERTPKLCECGHSRLAHTVPEPHSCFAHAQTCPCPAYQQLPHDEAVAQLKRNQQAAAERKSACNCPHPDDAHSIYGCEDGCSCEWMPKRKPMDPVRILGFYADKQGA